MPAAYSIPFSRPADRETLLMLNPLLARLVQAPSEALNANHCASVCRTDTRNQCLFGVRRPRSTRQGLRIRGAVR